MKLTYRLILWCCKHEQLIDRLLGVAIGAWGALLFIHLLRHH